MSEPSLSWQVGQGVILKKSHPVGGGAGLSISLAWMWTCNAWAVVNASSWPDESSDGLWHAN
jgi:hypothetical protein